MAHHPSPIILGAIPGIQPGYEFLNRAEVKAAGLHRDLYKGISCLNGQPAEAIVLSGGYEDDIDFGSIIWYTGEGGNQNGTQVADQTLTRGNLALQISYQQQQPVRVIRKVQEGALSYYQYAGLFLVTKCFAERGKAGFIIWRFLLEEMPPPASTSSPSLTTAAEPAVSYQPNPRKTLVVNRLIRDTKVMQQVKELYRFRCQVCSIQLKGPTSLYAEAAHIRPLGAPHHGPDKLNNVLCLCANHHVLFDLGAWAVLPSFDLLGISGKLHVAAKHEISLDHLAYHRKHIGNY